MDRRDRDRYGHNNYGTDYSGYRDYDREDAHYHSASNLTNLFERDYQRHRGYSGDDRDLYRNAHTYHEGNMGDRYEQRRREKDSYSSFRDDVRTDWNGNHYESGYDNHDRDWFRGHGIDYKGEDYWENHDSFRGDWGRNQEQGGNRRGGYLGSSYGDPYGRRDASRHTYNREAGYGQKNNTGFSGYDSASRSSDGDYAGGLGTTGRDERSIPGRRSYLQNRYY